MSAPLPPPPPRRTRPSTATIVDRGRPGRRARCSPASGLAGWAAWSLPPATTRRQRDGRLARRPSRAPRPRRRRTPPELARFYEQDLDWRACGDNQCARLTVPLDYAKPDGETIELAVLRVPATERGKRVGQLVVNPGGPGGSGVDYAAVGLARLRRHADPLLRHRRLRPARGREEHPAGVRRHRADRRVPQRRPGPRHPGRGRTGSTGSPASSARAA